MADKQPNNEKTAHPSFVNNNNIIKRKPILVKGVV